MYKRQLVKIVLRKSLADPFTKASLLKKDERKILLDNLKNFKLNFDHLDDFNHAIITRGGVDVKEINPKTMESKKVDDLYFVGEILDVDSLTGGFNLQTTFSQAYAASKSIKEKI